MEASDSLDRLRSLQADLVAFGESRLTNVERLWTELEESIDDFRALLDKRGRSDASRSQLQSDKIKIGPIEYSINDDFRQEVVQVADALDLDELEAARLYLESQESAASIDRPPALTAIFQFHGRREALLDSLRQAAQQAVELDLDSEEKPVFAQLIDMASKPPPTAAASISTGLWTRCLQAMKDIQDWINRVHERVQAAVVLGQNLNPFALEALEFQRDSLIRQHDSISTLACMLVKLDKATLEDYRALMKQAATLETINVFAVHYTLILLTCASHFGSSDGSNSLRDCRGFDQAFTNDTTTTWKLRTLGATSTVAWLAEYSGRYHENAPSSPLKGVDLDKETQTRSDRVMETLKDGAFHFLLLVSSKIRIEQWHDPAKAGLVRYLLGEVRTDQDDQITTSATFNDLFFRQLQSFADALITNMPDTIRRLKHEEDNNRRNAGSITLEGEKDNTLHLERFLVIVAYAFLLSPDAALDAFWSDPEGNMYGFLQWAAKRQSTPRVAAFCEMFQSIVNNEEAAEAAHRFLVDDGAATSSARLRRNTSLSWNLVFEELSFYAAKLQENPGALITTDAINNIGQVAEAESALMLECCLRLVSHMCKVSSSSRVFILAHQEFHLHEVLLNLVRSSVDVHLKACAFSTLTAMLTAKDDEVAKGMWEVLDSWIFDASTTRPTQTMGVTQVNLSRLATIASGFDEANAFVNLLQELVRPLPTLVSLDDRLPFPEQLGLAYRMPGIDQYVDFVLDKVFVKVTNDLHDLHQTWQLRATCLDFIVTCLSTFNENLVTFANLTQLDVDSAMSTSSLSAYVRLHPFARVVEWMFNDGVIASLFAAAHEEIAIVNAAASDSPLLLALTRSVQTIDMVLNLQSTYFDLVRPLIKTQSAARSKQVANPALACFEDVIMSSTGLIADLGYYCATGHEELTLTSLRLLNTLAKSRRFAGAASSGFRTNNSRLMIALQQDNDVDYIAVGFIAPLQLDLRELEMGQLAPGLAIKQGILDLLNNFLDMAPHQPGLAHGLLGFTCTGDEVSIRPETRFAKGLSLFHTIARLYAETVSLDEEHTLPWLASLRRASSDILRKLIKSRLTQRLVLDELRDSGFFEVVAVAQRPIGVRSEWLGKTCDDPEFLVTESVDMLRDYVCERAGFLEQAGHRLRIAAQSNESRLIEDTRSSLLGVTSLPGTERVSNATVFDLFDFVDLTITQPFATPKFTYMNDLDFAICLKHDGAMAPAYDLALVDQLLQLRVAELQQGGKLQDAAALQKCHDEAEVIGLCLTTQNRYTAFIHTQEAATKVWVNLVVVMLAAQNPDDGKRLAFTLHALQLVLPKLDQLMAQSSRAILPLARLAYTLVQMLETQTSDAVRDTGIANERLLHAFRTALQGITRVNDDIESRSIWYQIAYRILQRFSGMNMSADEVVTRQIRKLVEHAGERLVDGMCDDAVSSSGRTRMAVLLTLGSCVQLFHSVRGGHMIRLMMRLNFISVMVESIRGFAQDFEHDKETQGMYVLSLMR